MQRIVIDFAETFLFWLWGQKTKQSTLLSAVCMPVAMETTYEHLAKKGKKTLKNDGFYICNHFFRVNQMPPTINMYEYITPPG